MNQNNKDIIVVDLSVKQTSPAGSCVLSELEGLAERYNIYLFSNEIDEKIKKLTNYTIIEAPSAPLVLRYALFSTKVKNKVDKLLKKLPPNTIVQTTQGQYVNSTISYPHFCHRAYLKKHWKNSTVSGLRRMSRKLNHMYHSSKEAKAFRHAKFIVTPSHGLKREIIEFYPNCEKKIKVIANPVDIAHFQRPSNFDVSKARTDIGIKKDEVVIAFAALGDFARKGLPELMLSLNEDERLQKDFKILVIGGKPEEIKAYQKQANDLRISQRMHFVGFKQDIRPYLWLSDIFALPSLYEIFPLVCIQAGAAGLPLLVTKLHGVEEYIESEKNGWLVERNPQAIAKVLHGISNDDYNLEEMGKYALQTIKQYDHSSFRKKWLDVYTSLSQSDK